MLCMYRFIILHLNYTYDVTYQTCALSFTPEPKLWGGTTVLLYYCALLSAGLLSPSQHRSCTAVLSTAELR